MHGKHLQIKDRLAISCLAKYSNLTRSLHIEVYKSFVHSAYLGEETLSSQCLSLSTHVYRCVLGHATLTLPLATWVYRCHLRFLLLIYLILITEWQRHFNDSMRNAESRRRYENQKYHEFLNCRDAEQNTPLHLAAQTGNSSVSEILIEQGAGIDLRNTALQTPLHLAAIYGSPEVLTLIIRKGGDVNSQDNQGKTPLHR